MRMWNTLKLASVTAFAAVVISAYGGKDDPTHAVKPATGIKAMTEADRIFYTTSFTTLATVPYGRCWPTNLYKIVLGGRKVQDSARFISIKTPKAGFKQNEGYSEWLRVKTLILERGSLRILSAKASVGPFASDDAMQSYLCTEVRPDLNGQMFVIKNETSPTNTVMRFVCKSKWGGNYVLQIIPRVESPTAIMLDAVGSVME